MGISNCSGPCELCVSNGHCLAGRGDDDFKLDDEKFKSIMENWWNTYVAMPVRRGLRLDQEADESKEENEMKLDSWKDCVIKDVSWKVNDQIKNGDTIYRITTDYVDIKGKMTITNVDGPRISLDFDGKCGIPKTTKIYVMPEMRVFKTDSENDPGILLGDYKDIFNPELRVGKLYRVVNSHLFFQYMMYVRSINGDSMYTNIINMITDLDNKGSLAVTGKMLDIAELSEYKFDEIDIFKNCKIPFDVEKWFNGSSHD